MTDYIILLICCTAIWAGGFYLGQLWKDDEL